VAVVNFEEELFPFGAIQYCFEPENYKSSIAKNDYYISLIHFFPEKKPTFAPEFGFSPWVLRVG
jgi:hypothetical protein